MAKNKNKMRSGVAVAAQHRNSAGPMRHRLALRGNARSVAEAEAIEEYDLEAQEYEAHAYEY